MIPVFGIFLLVVGLGFVFAPRYALGLLGTIAANRVERIHRWIFVVIGAAAIATGIRLVIR